MLTKLLTEFKIFRIIQAVRTMSGKIGTHNGSFHCDEAFACFMLKRLNCFKAYEIIRTRDPAILKDCDIVVDVGGQYDHDKQCYDHHQKEFTHSMKTLGILDFETKLSSAGLIYAHYGKQLIGELLNISSSSEIVKILYKKLYETFVEQLDAIDNGIPQFDGTPRYHISGGITGRIGHLNPNWNEEGVDVDKRFQSAMELVGKEFTEAVMYLYNVWWPAREIVLKAVEDRYNVDLSGRIILMENGGVPWKEHFFMIEEEKHLQMDKITYMIYGDSTSNGWRVQAIPANRLTSFENRLPLPAEWRSLRDDKLSLVSGISDCVFVHTNGFIGGNKTRDGAIEMARKALQIGITEDSSGNEIKKVKIANA